MKALATIGSRAEDKVGSGTLRRDDLEAFSKVSAEVGGGPVLITGAGPGRLALATGLAAASAAAGTRTALLECDLAEPQLAAALGLAIAPGLQEYIRLEAEAPQLLQPLVLGGPASGKATDPLVCIVAGEPSAEGLSATADSEHFRHAVGRLRSAYELLVLLGPPLGDESGDLVRVAAAADSSVACVDASLADGRSGRKLEKVLRKLPARNAGVVAYG